MEITLSVEARVKALKVVNKWPAPSREMMRLMDRLATALEPTEEDKAACDWREVRGGNETLLVFRPGVKRAITLGDEDAKILRQIMEPSERVTYDRTERALLDEFELALGGFA